MKIGFPRNLQVWSWLESGILSEVLDKVEQSLVHAIVRTTPRSSAKWVVRDQIEVDEHEVYSVRNFRAV